MSSPPADTPSSPTIVVRTDGEWWSTTVGNDSVDRTSWAALAARIDDTDGVIDHMPAPADAEMVAPAWTFTGLLTAGGLVIEDPAGGSTTLDRADLAVLDALTGPMALADLAEAIPAADADDAGARIARLIATGAVRGLPTDDAPTPDQGVHGRALKVARPVVPPSGGPHPGGPAGRIPVYAVWHPQIGPLLALGMLTAAARAHDGGALNAVYEIRRPETAASFLADLAGRTGPAVLLCSDYVWSLTENLDAARAAVALNPDLLVLHGGPSSPKYADDAERFLAEHDGVAHVLTRGEGEHLLIELLAALAPSLEAGANDLPLEALAAIDGLTFRDPRTGAVVRTAERARIADLDDLPSPYLTGEFDHIAGPSWTACLSVETNRGCPYGCTFCDWGSSTLSRIRKFDLDRVEAEIQWAADRGIHSLNLTDANFGIMSRDIETATRIASIRTTTGFPELISFYPAKNTTKHLTRIVDVLLEAGVGTTASISLQTSDPSTLEAIDRSNISTDHYVALAADYRRRGLPLQGDLLLGLPGQSYDSYKRDLQFNLDHEILPRTWQVHSLPNAPMNDPEYRARFAIETEGNRVLATSTFTREDRTAMLRLRDAEIIFERFGLLRHLLRWLQWEHGVPAMDVMHRIVDLASEAPGRYPALTWVLTHFERFPTAPIGWSHFYGDATSFLADEHGIAASSDLTTVLAVQQALMPTPGRTFPLAVSLDHDYATYYRDATDSLFTTGHAGGPRRPLRAYGPATLTITGDPLDLCEAGVEFARWGPDGEMETDFTVGANSAYELASPLLRLLPHVAANAIPAAYRGPSGAGDVADVQVSVGSR